MRLATLSALVQRYFEREMPNATPSGFVEQALIQADRVRHARPGREWLAASAGLLTVLLALASALRLDYPCDVALGGGFEWHHALAQLERELRFIRTRPTQEGAVRALAAYWHMLELAGCWRSQVKVMAARSIETLELH